MKKTLQQNKMAQRRGEGAKEHSCIHSVGFFFMVGIHIWKTLKSHSLVSLYRLEAADVI